MDGRPRQDALPAQGGSWTAERFAEWAAGRSDGDYELYQDGPRMMTGAYWPHGQIVKNLHRFLEPRIPEHLNTYGPQDLIRTVGELAKAPDVFIAPKVPRGLGPRRIRYFDGSLVVFEIVSEDRDDDFRAKLHEYEQVPTILRYVVVESLKPGYTTWSRAHGGDPWTPHGYEGHAPIPLPEVGLDVPLRVVYAETDLDPTGR